ncbi:MAG: ABC transporter ATP-binding protein [Burkholderiaceae bacterium]|nr:ABC transporter ATP-binding protein [Burkholderiaceae bacterium]
MRVHIGGREIVRAEALSLRAGAWTAITGPNGAGKTTLLKALASLLPDQSSGGLRNQVEGEIQLDGRAIERWPARARARRLAWLGQNESGAEDLCARDVVMLGRLPHQGWLGAPSAADRSAVECAMRRTQSWDWRERTLGSLSGGERQRVLLARALAVQAPLLLMDEPLTSLDAPHQADWLHTVRELVAAGATVVSVLHELNVALQADEIVVLHEGRLTHHGPGGDARTHAALCEAFAQRIDIRALDGQWVVLLR